MNIVYIEHYAGTPALGMEFRPYYLAREWVRAGHRVQILAASYSHVRARQPEVGHEPEERDRRRHRLPLVSDARLPGQRPGPRAQHLGVPEPGVARHRPHRARHEARRRHRVQHLPDGHLGGAPARAPLPRPSWSSRCTTCGRCRRSSSSGMSPKHPFARLCFKAESDAYRDADVVVSMLPVRAQLHGLARPRPRQARDRAQRHLARRLGRQARTRSAATWPACWPPRARSARRWWATPARWASPTRSTRCSTPPPCCAATRGPQAALRAGGRRPPARAPAGSACARKA